MKKFLIVSLVFALFLLASCTPEKPAPPAEAPKGYYRIIQYDVDGKAYHSIVVKS